jgi:hypothetical protein
MHAVVVAELYHKAVQQLQALLVNRGVTLDEVSKDHCPICGSTLGLLNLSLALFFYIRIRRQRQQFIVQNSWVHAAIISFISISCTAVAVV